MCIWVIGWMAAGIWVDAADVGRWVSGWRLGTKEYQRCPLIFMFSARSHLCQLEFSSEQLLPKSGKCCIIVVIVRVDAFVVGECSSV